MPKKPMSYKSSYSTAYKMRGTKSKPYKAGKKAMPRKKK